MDSAEQGSSLAPLPKRSSESPASSVDSIDALFEDNGKLFFGGSPSSLLAEMVTSKSPQSTGDTGHAQHDTAPPASQKKQQPKAQNEDISARHLAKSPSPVSPRTRKRGLSLDTNPGISPRIRKRIRPSHPDTDASPSKEKAHERIPGWNYDYSWSSNGSLHESRRESQAVQRSLFPVRFSPMRASAPSAMRKEPYEQAANSRVITSSPLLPALSPLPFKAIDPFSMPMTSFARKRPMIDQTLVPSQLQSTQAHDGEESTLLRTDTDLVSLPSEPGSAVIRRLFYGAEEDAEYPGSATGFGISPLLRSDGQAIESGESVYGDIGTLLKTDFTSPLLSMTAGFPESQDMVLSNSRIPQGQLQQQEIMRTEAETVYPPVYQNVGQVQQAVPAVQSYYNQSQDHAATVQVSDFFNTQTQSTWSPHPQWSVASPRTTQSLANSGLFIRLGNTNGQTNSGDGATARVYVPLPPTTTDDSDGDPEDLALDSPPTRLREDTRRLSDDEGSELLPAFEFRAENQDQSAALAKPSSHDEDRPWIRVNASRGLNRRFQAITSFNPDDTYTPPIIVPQAFLSFTYTPHYELSTASTYTPSQMLEFLMNHPLRNRTHPATSNLVLRIQTTPADSARRYATMQSSRCRLSCCPSRRNLIAVGHFRVAIDEVSTLPTNDNVDPFLNQAYMHLYCMERFFDFPRLCRDFNVVIEDRQLAKEPSKYNRMRVKTQRERDVAMNFIRACRSGGRPPRYPRQVRQVRAHVWAYEGTLCHELNVAKLSEQHSCYQKIRQKRGEKQSVISRHLGNLEMQSKERDKTRRNAAKRRNK